MKTLAMYIDGQFISHSGDYREVLNPATEEVIAKEPKGGTAEVDLAVAAAKKAQPGWEQLPAVQRGAYLRKIAQGIRERAQQLTDTIVAEGGKTKELAEVEVLFTADYLDYQAEWARRYEGEIIQSDRPNENIFLFKRPRGVVAGILPWNFPFFLIARKMGPALLTGNTIVIKPSSVTPINAHIFAEIVHAAGLPKGVFNVVNGAGAEIGNHLAQHPQVDLVSLTGSVEAGRQVMIAAAQNITKVSLELGGKAPAIVLKDADLDLAVKSIVASRVINTGQVCNCAERVYVHQSVHDGFVAKLTEAMKTVRFGNPATATSETLDMGPLVEKRAVEAVAAKVEKALKQGATLHLGGKRPEQKGFFFEPTILTHVKNDMDIMHEETFGPVLPIATFESLDEVIAMANNSIFGLTSSVYTQNLNDAFYVTRRLQFGETYINRENFEAMQGFHAGWKQSGIGGADGKHGLEEYLQTQVVYLQTTN
ncbi:aldehyde dehydrogenase [Pasteurellaceae bacterium USgator11]|nr:aldehyde dehydrogenase [Pasteurellaceae bacterium USgator41]TNG93953.1 aldehyde dehydrogenase [Pasteurellaceae bacterium UScroc12]TNG96090.1 aldehyde dehydrogenase [Pasteurellaceae bacterium UScroc31]TNH00765.1 aldehyde dehydrogenase [Pasteurellaceae bacterium USgator11]